MKLFFSYLKRHFKIICLLAVFVLIFAIIFSLYNLPVEAVIYASAICIVAGVILFVAGYAGYVSRHRELLDFQNRVTVSLDELPIARGVIEEDYQELLTVLKNQAVSVMTDAQTQTQEMTDYYTLWVHQIKTPIAAMRLLIQSGGESEENTALLVELQRIEQYVEMVLSYMRLESDSSDYILKEQNLDDIIRQALRKYAKLFILRKNSLEYTETGISVLTDEKWLLFVIEQVLSNALKYTNNGKIRIYAEGYILVIEDTGIGIRPEDLPRISERGFTGYNGREDKKSTGIGLYLCNRAFKQIGHTIHIESVKGKGTKVYMDLATNNRVVE